MIGDISDITSERVPQKPLQGRLFVKEPSQPCDLSKEITNTTPLLGGLVQEANQLREWLNDDLLGTHGLLLTGPSGCGKTLLVNQAADNWSASLIALNGAQLLADYYPDSSSSLTHEVPTNSFRAACERILSCKTGDRCILFIDDIDLISVLPGGPSNDDDVNKRLFLLELEELFDTLTIHSAYSCDTDEPVCYDPVLLPSTLNVEGSVRVIASTSRPTAVSDGIKRLFLSQISLGTPTVIQRIDIIRVILEHSSFSYDVNDLKFIAEATPGFTGSDLVLLLKNAAVEAFPETNTSEYSTEEVSLTQLHIIRALRRVTPSFQKGSIAQHPVEHGLSSENDPLLTADSATGTSECSWKGELEDEKCVDGGGQKSYKTIGGLDDVKALLVEAVEWPLRYAGAYRRIGAKRPHGVLLHGPPGCGKTTLVRAAARSCNVNFFCVSGAQLYSPYQGESEKNISTMFEQARAGAPSILFIDEIDSVVGSRATSLDSGKEGGGVNERVMTALLNQMDGIAGATDDEAESNVLVVAATNRLDMIDKALLRPGRMDKIIYVPPPDFQGRVQILKLYTHDKPIRNFDVKEFAQLTEGRTGADLESICREACLKAVEVEGFNCQSVDGRYFKQVLNMKQQLLLSQPQSIVSSTFTTSTSPDMATVAPELNDQSQRVT